ncbi:hypothetical protein PMIN06_002102 [Paraphaeosphaeria minitans]
MHIVHLLLAPQLIYVSLFSRVLLSMCTPFRLAPIRVHGHVFARDLKLRIVKCRLGDWISNLDRRRPTADGRILRTGQAPAATRWGVNNTGHCTSKRACFELDDDDDDDDMAPGKTQPKDNATRVRRRWAALPCPAVAGVGEGRLTVDR